MKKTSYALLVCLLFACCASMIAQKTSEPGRSVGVVKLQIKQGVNFPESKLDVMTAEIKDELDSLKRFGQVTVVATEADASNSDLILTGTITDYDAGSRAKRYLIGFGAGKTKVVGEIKIVERSTGNVLLQKQVDGKVIIGVFGGNSNGATRGFAKEVAKVTKKELFK